MKQRQALAIIDILPSPKQKDTAKLLTPAQRKQYDENGFVLVEHALDDEVLHELRNVTQEVCSGAHGLKTHSQFLDLEPTHTPELPRVRRIKTPQLAHPFYRELAQHPQITDPMSSLIGEDIRLRLGGKVNIKSPGIGSPIEWHQDWAFYPHTNQDVLAVGILLDDMDETNGPVMFVPGSHKGPIFDHHSKGAFCGAIDVHRENLDLSGAVEIHATAGSMTIHHARLIHGSASNTSSKPRRVLFFEFAAADAWPLGGVEHVGDLDEFNSRIVRGNPTLQPRLESVPVRMPLPVAPFQGSIYENQRTLENRYFADAPG